MSGHVFVDETKERGYLIVASVVAPADLEQVRRSLRALVLPGQRRLHMSTEGNPRRRSQAAVLGGRGELRHGRASSRN